MSLPAWCLAENIPYLIAYCKRLLIRVPRIQPRSYYYILLLMVVGLPKRSYYILCIEQLLIGLDLVKRSACFVEGCTAVFHYWCGSICVTVTYGKNLSHYGHHKPLVNSVHSGHGHHKGLRRPYLVRESTHWGKYNTRGCKNLWLYMYSGTSHLQRLTCGTFWTSNKIFKTFLLWRLNKFQNLNSKVAEFEL